jgi:DNA invertase Pin-like site-specific DNA recombinase
VPWLELERALIVERVKAGLRNARAKGKQLGRPKKTLDTKRIVDCAIKASVGGESPQSLAWASERSTKPIDALRLS